MEFDDNGQLVVNTYSKVIYYSLDHTIYQYSMNNLLTLSRSSTYLLASKRDICSFFMYIQSKCIHAGNRYNRTRILYISNFGGDDR